MQQSEVVVEGQGAEDMQQDIPLNEQKVKFGTGTTVKVGQHRADDVDIYYELHGHGPTKLLFIMGKPMHLKSRKIFIIIRIPDVQSRLEAHGFNSIL